MTAYGMEFILSRIPHRPPFLWLDEVLELSEDRILAVKTIPKDLELFQGHFPQDPIVPGVLLCEAVFQAGAVYISETLHREGGKNALKGGGVPVLTRINSAKFKRIVRPGDRITLEVRVQERMQAAWFMKGTVTVGGKPAAKVAFACTRKG